jgi:hypothetical protein
VYSVCLLYWYKYLRCVRIRPRGMLSIRRSFNKKKKVYSVYLLYWYKRTNTDAAHLYQINCIADVLFASHFKVLTSYIAALAGMVLTLLALLVHKYSLYWYKRCYSRRVSGCSFATSRCARWHGTHFACFTGTKVQILTLRTRM